MYFGRVGGDGQICVVVLFVSKRREDDYYGCSLWHDGLGDNSSKIK